MGHKGDQIEKPKYPWFFLQELYPFLAIFVPDFLYRAYFTFVNGTLYVTVSSCFMGMSDSLPYV